MEGIIAEATAPHELLAVGPALLHNCTAPKSSISIQSRRRLLLHLLLSFKTRRSHRPAHAFLQTIQECRSTLWNKGGVDGRTREARIKVGAAAGRRQAKTDDARTLEAGFINAV